MSNPAEPIPQTILGPAPTPDGVGEQFGRYRILRQLGQGGMGAVYLAHDTQLDRPVALKVPRFPAGSREQAERFCREARAAAALSHPNLCPVHDVGEIGGQVYLTMGYVEGHTLAELIRGGPPLPMRPVADLVRKLALALDEAHAKGIVHRDLKPANIMVNRRNEPVVLDFGLARVARDDARLTTEGTLLGTPAYMPPEQVRGEQEAVGPKSDIYSLGVVLYELLTGKLPFEGSITAIISAVLTREPTPPRQHRPEIDAALEAICLKAMAKEPGSRFASMAEFAAALDSYLNGGQAGATIPLASPNDTAQLGTSLAGPATQLIGQLMARLEASDERARKAAKWPWLVAAAALLLLAAGVVALLMMKKDPPAPTMVVVYLNVTQLEKAEPNLKFVVIGGQRIPRDQLDKPIFLPEGTHSLSIEDADGKVVEVGDFALRGEDDKKTIEVTPDRKVALVETKEKPKKPDDPDPLPGEEINLAASANGGWLADAPAQYDDSTWAAKHLIDLPGTGQYASPGAGPIAVVVGFKDGKAARIARVGINPFANEAKRHWVSRVKVEVSETYPFTGFEEVGEFDVDETPDDVVWPLPRPRVARFVRFTFLKNRMGSYMECSEIMAYGSLLSKAPPPPLVNVAAKAAGGRIERISSEYGDGHKAEFLLDGNLGKGWCSKSNERQLAVIELGRMADVRHVAVNPYTGGSNPDEAALNAEVFLSRSGRADDFQRAGKIAMEAVGRDHVLTLDKPTPARFVKLMLEPRPTRGYVMAHEVKVIADRVKEDDELALFNGRNLDGWTLKNKNGKPKWAVVGGVRLAEGIPSRFDPDDGGGVLLNGGDGKGVNLVSDVQLGDCLLSLEFNVPQGGNSGVYFQGRYEVQLADSYAKRDKKPEKDDCGGVPYVAAPRVHAGKEAGQWQTLEAVFRALRFDREGRKAANARLVRVELNGTVIHENVELRPTLGHIDAKEAALGPLMLQGDQGVAAFRNVRLTRR